MDGTRRDLTGHDKTRQDFFGDNMKSLENTYGYQVFTNPLLESYKKILEMIQLDEVLTRCKIPLEMKKEIGMNRNVSDPEDLVLGHIRMYGFATSRCIGNKLKVHYREANLVLKKLAREKKIKLDNNKWVLYE